MCDCNSSNQPFSTPFSCLQEQLLAALSLAPCLGQPLLDGTDLTINNMWHFDLEVWEIHGSRHIMKWHDISMLLCLWWFYVQICSAFLWIFHGPFFLDKAHGNCSNSVPNPPLPLTSTPRLHAVFLASHSGLRRTWPQMQCHSVTGCSATCHFAHLVTSEIRVCTTAIKASSSWESPCSLHTGSPGEFQDRIQSNYRVENLYEFKNEYSIVILISWNRENEALKCVERNVLLHPNDEICTQYIDTFESLDAKSKFPT